MKPRLIVIGSLNMDMVIQAPRIPMPGETILGAGYLQMFPGGKGATQAYGAAKLGADVSMIGRVGDDSFGERLIQNLSQATVDTRYINHDPDAATGIALIVVDERGQNSIVVSSGANGRVTIEDINQGEEFIHSAEVLLLQLEIPLNAVLQGAKLAKNHGVTTILNPAPAQPLPGELLGSIDYLIPNETETAILSGHETNTEEEIKQAAEVLRRSGTKTMIMTMGSRGALLVTETEFCPFPAFPIDPVDTTAAGDAFVAGFAVALAEGKSIQDSIRFGNAAGALACTKLGAQPSLPGRQELERLIRTDQVK
jgi:ribokinase